MILFDMWCIPMLFNSKLMSLALFHSTYRFLIRNPYCFTKCSGMFAQLKNDQRLKAPPKE